MRAENIRPLLLERVRLGGLEEPPAIERTANDYERVAFVTSETPEARAAGERLAAQYGAVEAEAADVIVALGGDGLMLQTLHRHLCDRKPVYGMNRGSVGFLMNEYREESLLERLRAAEMSTVHPLRMNAVDLRGESHEALAINEVSVFRQSYQAGKLRISVDGRVRLEELICDGVLVATPAGSTAYNLSVSGPILPVGSPLLALTPISPFRPRRWGGAVLPNTARFRIEVLESEKRPMTAVANHREFRKISEVSIAEVSDIKLMLLFDRGHSLEERILDEQFSH
jgi:NAD+ kinase